LLPLKTVTFFGRRDPRYSSPPRATANRKALAPVVPSSGAMVAGRHRPEADSYRAIAVRCWPASRSLGCT